MLGYLASPVHCVCSCTCPVMSTQCLLNLASPVHSVCSLTWSVLCTLCVYMYPASLVHSVCSISYLVLCTMCVPLVTQSCAFCVFLYLSSVYAMCVCSNIWPFLCTDCVCSYICSIFVHSVGYWTWLVFVHLLCVLGHGQSCELCVCLDMASPEPSVSCYFWPVLC